MAATTVESFLNPANPLTKRDCRSHSSLSSASFSVRFQPILVPITPHSTTRRKSWTNISTIARNTIINVSPKLGSRRLGTCFLSLDPIHCSWFNSRLVVAVPTAAFASSSAGKQDDDSDEHSEIDNVENDDQKKKKNTTTEIGAGAAAADDVENEKKMISSSSDDIDQDIEVLLNAAAEEEEQEEAAAAAANWNGRQIVVISRKLVDSFKEYLISEDNKSPAEVIKNIIVETFAYSSSSSSSTPDHLIKDASKLEEFYLGIPYGALLSLGGFLSFMITGSISGIRFGVILGGTLLALSISSLRYSYAKKKSRRRRDQSSAPLQQQQAIMKLGQAAIAGIIFLRHLGLLFQRPSFPNSFTAFISGGMVVFYLYTIMLDGDDLTVRKNNNRSELA